MVLRRARAMALRSWTVSDEYWVVKSLYSYQVVEPVHQPQDGHDPFVQLANEGDLARIGFLVGARVVACLRGCLEHFFDLIEGC